MERPWIKFYTRDWLDDLALRKCSAEARAVLMDLMCLANEGAPYGHLSDTHGPLTAQFIAGRCALPLPRFKKAVAELLQYERLSQTDAGVLFIKRMVRDEEIRMKRAAGGIKSVDHPNTQKGGVEGYPSGSKEGGVRSDSDSTLFGGLKPPNTEKPSPREQLPRGYALDEQYDDFRKACRSLGMNVIEEDFTGGAWHEWQLLDFSQRADAIDGINARRNAGMDPAFVKGPKNYLKNREWKRPVQTPALSLAEQIANA